MEPISQIIAPFDILIRVRKVVMTPILRFFSANSASDIAAAMYPNKMGSSEVPGNLRYRLSPMLVHHGRGYPDISSYPLADCCSR
ncbi:hypothetical protein D9M71_686710 [compost metagenome]